MSAPRPKKPKIIIIIIIILSLYPELASSLGRSLDVIKNANEDYDLWTTEEKELGGLIETIHADAVENTLDSSDLSAHASALETALANC